MDYLNFNNMDDESFRKDFLKFLNQHQQRMNDFMKRMYNNDNFNSDEMFNNIISKMNREDLNDQSGEDEYGMWGRNNWTSEDGSISYDSFFREFNPYKELKPQTKKEVTTLELLESKLKKAIMVEDYESAAKIRDLMKSLRED
jgi:adenine C2-methylase RlmN of 23S rRNA A2503 and tRNA A37